MAALLKQHNTRDKRISRLEAECANLRRELEKKEDALRFLPPESFLAYYSLLVEAVYITRSPGPETETHKLRRHGLEIPVRNYQAYKILREVDGQLYRIKRRISEYLSQEL